MVVIVLVMWIQSTIETIERMLLLRVIKSEESFVLSASLKVISSMLLYQFTCGICNSTYIGETKRHYIVRSYEHLGISLLTDRSLKYNADYATAINKHCVDNSHNCSMNNFKIVGHASNKFHLRLKESLLISQVNPNIINVQKQSIPLDLFG